VDGNTLWKTRLIVLCVLVFISNSISVAVEVSTPAVTICQLGSNETSLINLWHLNTGTGSTAYDVVGTTDGTITNQTWGTGKFSYSLHGAAEGGDYTYFPGLTFSAAYTISGWFRIDDLSSDYIWCTGRTNQLVILLIARNASNYIDYLHRNAAGGYVEIQVTMSAAFDWLAWHYIVLTWDGSYINGYLDGELQGGFPAAAAGIYALQDGTWLGDKSTDLGAQSGFIGDLDEFAHYARVLSAAEIYHIYHRNPKVIQ